ncbi:hypothetical protein GCM10012285_62270 [Streptomyces kronopolitis]|uniref:Uncharacterized protein n=1 Tax=Streptomyces kronopolitis TaxID=1612435 RepID=A0ABQ2K1I6_9ACTN|nr:hypothetical protein GCM10012285_62270 [Streptomyces kronopolitis]
MRKSMDRTGGVVCARASSAGARGDRTPVAVCGNKAVSGNEREPLRGIAVRGGLHSWEKGHRTFSGRVGGRRLPVNSHGRGGVVAYDGLRGRGNGARTVRADRLRAMEEPHSANSAMDVTTPSGSGFGRAAARRPAYPDNPGCEGEVFGITRAPRSGAGRPAFRFITRHPGYPLGARFVRADTRH